MMKNVKMNDKLIKKISVVGFSLVMTLSGFMLGREYESNKTDKLDLSVPTNMELDNTSNTSSQLIDNSVNLMPNLINEVYVYNKYILAPNGELIYAGEVHSDVPPVDSEVVIYKYDHSYVDFNEEEKAKSI